MKLLIIVLSLIFLLMMIFSCSNNYTYKEPEWEMASETHTCTTVQMMKVHWETDYCYKNTSYGSSYCYGTSIMRNCVKIKKEKVK